ncbi:MAG: SRPBCC family protein [Chloroflexota bacterium]
MTVTPTVRIEMDVASDRDILWALLADLERWPDLLPHMLHLQCLARRGDKQLVRTRERRAWWLATTVRSAIWVRAGERRLLRRYSGGVLESWSVEPLDAGCARLRCEIVAATAWGRIRTRLMIAPSAREMAGMLATLAAADHLARSGALTA